MCAASDSSLPRRVRQARFVWRLGRTAGGAEIAEGTIGAGEIVALYDLPYGGDFSPQSVRPGEKLFLTLSAKTGTYPDDYYLVYGPRNGRGAPSRAAGEGIGPEGKPAFPISYRLFTSIGPGDPHEGEPRFEFIRQITRPPYLNAAVIRDPQRKAGANETAVDRTWRILAAPPGNAVIDTAVEDLRLFFKRVMDLEIPVVRATIGPETLDREKVIIVGDSKALPEKTERLKRSEDYRFTVEPRRIVLRGADDRGIMRAVYYLEDVMRFAQGPVVRQQDTVRHCRFNPRITHRVGPANTFLTELSQPTIYTDGFFSMISHQGFNAIFLYGSLEELTYDSKVFPELNNSRLPRRFSAEVFPEVLDEHVADRRFRRLNDLIERGKRYGIDVYLYLATNYHHPVPSSFYEKHPDCRGVSFGNSLCTSHPDVQAYLSETVGNLFRRARGLKGLLMIFDSEGFYTCLNQRSKCPRCKHHSQEAIAVRCITTAFEAMKAVDPNTELIAWSYGRGDPEWVLRAIELMPQGVTYQAGFAKGSVVERGGVRHIAGDYLISEIGPPAFFHKQKEIAIRRGMKLSTKTSHSYANEFVNVPYIPVSQQFYRRIAAIRGHPVESYLANWSHHGYSPNRNAEILKWYSWDNAGPIDRLLHDLAAVEFGDEAADGFVRAWDHFSEAIRYYPYSDPIARHPGPIQVGPAHPLYLDRAKRVPKDWRTFVNDLSGTKPWGPELAVACFEKFLERWQKGLTVMEDAMRCVPPERRDAARREFGVAKSIFCSARTYTNVTRFLAARKRLYAETDKDKRSEILAEMQGIAEAELANAKEALPLCEADSRIGYASGGARIGGLYTPAAIRAKIKQVETLLDEELPRFEKKYFTHTDRSPPFAAH